MEHLQERLVVLVVVEVTASQLDLHLKQIKVTLVVMHLVILMVAVVVLVLLVMVELTHLLQDLVV